MDMTDALSEKTQQYHQMLVDALEHAEVATRPHSPMEDIAETHLEMAQSYLADGRHFQDNGDLPNALAAFAYGHGWLDAAVRTGFVTVPEEVSSSFPI